MTGQGFVMLFLYYYLFMSSCLCFKMCEIHCGVKLFIHLPCSVVGSSSALAGLYIQLSDKQVGGTDEVWGLRPQTDE